MKKITFLLTLMLAFFGVSANAQVAFEASDAPTSDGWATNTKWYKMSLRNFYVSLLDADAEGNLYAKSSGVPYGEQAMWCIVGDETNGYKIYNKRAGVNKVFGVTNMSQDGAARAQLVDASNTSFSTSFTLATKNDVDNVFYLKDNESGIYANKRGDYFSNWTATNWAYGDEGSQIRFYAVEDVDADIAQELTSVKATLQSAITTANTVKGDGLGYYSASSISAAQATYDNTNATADDIRAAIAALQPNQPKAGVIYRIVNAFSGFESTQHVKKGVYANGTSIWWGNVDTSDPYQYWFFEPTNGGYYLKNAVAHTYAYTANELQTTPSHVVTIAWPINSDGVPVANLRTGNNSPFHANNHGNGAGVSSALVGYGTFGSETEGASAWYIVPATVEEINTITTTAMASKYPTTTKHQVGLYPAEDVDNFVNSFAPFATVSTLDAAVEAFNALGAAPQPITFSADKYYRFVNVGTSTTDNENTLGTKDGKAFCSTGNNSNIDFVWQVLPSTTANRYYLKHANTNTYLQPVLNGQTAQTALAEATSDYELRNTESGVFKLYNTSGYPAQVETNDQNTNYLNGWDSDNAKWNIFEVNAVEVSLNTVGSSAYASAYLPFSVSAVEGAEAYVGALNADNSALDMTKVEGVPANNGFVLVGNGSKATLTIGNADAVTNNSLTGTNTGITLGDDTRANYLVFGKNADVVGFYTPSTSVTKIGANKAYLDATALTGAAAIAMNFGGTTTAINTANVNNANVNAPVFDLSGRRIVAPVKGGVYIQNGKKFIK